MSEKTDWLSEDENSPINVLLSDLGHVMCGNFTIEDQGAATFFLELAERADATIDALRAENARLLGVVKAVARCPFASSSDRPNHAANAQIAEAIRSARAALEETT